MLLQQRHIVDISHFNIQNIERGSENSAGDLFNIRLARSIDRELVADPNIEYGRLVGGSRASTVQSCVGTL